MIEKLVVEDGWKATWEKCEDCWIDTSVKLPDGYKLSEDSKSYEPVEKELELLDRAFEYVRTVGPAKAARWLSTASGRKISNPGLTKRMNKGLYL